jgi:hypothetical protein
MADINGHCLRRAGYGWANPLSVMKLPALYLTIRMLSAFLITAAAEETIGLASEFRLAVVEHSVPRKWTAGCQIHQVRRATPRKEVL